jgi:hypothetical protein
MQYDYKTPEQQAVNTRTAAKVFVDTDFRNSGLE